MLQTFDITVRIIFKKKQKHISETEYKFQNTQEIISVEFRLQPITFCHTALLTVSWIIALMALTAS